jgi:hypothetical protein
MSTELEQFLARTFGNPEPVAIVRAEFSAQGRAFIVYDADGNGWGGDINDVDAPVEQLKTELLDQLNDGSLANYFSIFEPVPVDDLAEKRGENTDWADIYNAA